MAKISGTKSFMRLSASLVLYNNDNLIFERAIESIIDSHEEVFLSIYDNSPLQLSSKYFSHPRVTYRHDRTNVGFGAGHNRAFALVSDWSDLHFIVNPDITFDRHVISELLSVFRSDDTIMAGMPDICNEDGSSQNLCKNLPTPVDLIARRFIPFDCIKNKITSKYVLSGLPSDAVVDIPNLSGCFLAVRSKAFRQINGFDEAYFMYMEDIDLVRRLGDIGRTVYVPFARVHHGYAKGSYKLGRLFFSHIRSAIRYFNKWGWFKDFVRAKRNRATKTFLADYSKMNDK